MKVKVKFDQKAITDFLLHSAEKIVLGVVGVIFLWMLYSSLSKAGGLGKSPTELQAEVSKAKSTIDRTDPNDVIADLKVKDYVTAAAKSRVPIDVAPYQFAAAWNPPLSDPRTPRIAPPLLAAQDLRCVAGVGAIRTSPGAGAENARGGAPVRDGGRGGVGGGRGISGRGGPGVQIANAGEQLLGKRWIVVTGLVPVTKQEAAYSETFRSAVNYSAENDHPIYMGYRVERVEVANAAEAANPDWSKAKKITSKQAMEEAMKEWSPAGEVVAADHILETLVFPLPPLVNRAWDDSVAHKPDIPLSKTDEMILDRDGRGGGRGDDGRLGGGRPTGGAMVRGVAFAGAAAKGGGMARGDADAGEFGTVEATAEQGRAFETPSTEEAAPSQNKLFRFFDFDVEPGKHYVYRTCLVLWNPNYGQKAGFLEKPELAKSKYLETKWSDPSSPIVVPRDTRLFAVSATPARGSNEPTGQVMAATWLLAKGLQLNSDFSLGRGQVANYFNVSTKSGTADFVSDATIVDIRGGDRLPGSGSDRPLVPAQFLVVDPNGTLRVLDENDDAALREEIKAEQAAASPQGAAPGRGGGRGPLDMMNEGRGGRGGRE